MTDHILVVDDEPSLIGVLEPVLGATGYKMTSAAMGRHALAIADEADPDVILLDLGLPDMDGKEAIRVLREHNHVPIIIISARHQEAEKIAALDEGADDYVNKPFEIGELMAGIRAALRRRSNPRTNHKIGLLEIDFPGRRVTLGDETVKLSPKEYADRPRAQRRPCRHAQAPARGGLGRRDDRHAISPGLYRPAPAEDRGGSLRSTPAADRARSATAW